MAQPFQTLVFRFYEQPRLRNWFYTLAFAIFVPTGFRFAVLAWEYGDWFDRPLSIVSGFIIGATTAVTLLRIWKVPPQQTVNAEAAAPDIEPSASHLTASEIHAEAVRIAARNRVMARGAAALGSSRGWPFQH